MARFIGMTKGRKGPGASRLGSAPSGIEVTAQGWNAGVSVFGQTQALDKDRDEFAVWLNNGSNGGGVVNLLGHLRETPSGRIFVLSPEMADALGAETDTIRL